MLDWLFNRFTFGTIKYDPVDKGPFRDHAEKERKAALSRIAAAVDEAQKSAEAAGVRHPIVSNRSWPGGSRVFGPRRRDS